MALVRAMIGLGANLGKPVDTIKAALADLRHVPQSRFVAASHLYASAPVDADGDDYVNAVACLDTTLSAPALLRALQNLEQQAGRERRYRNAPRTLDLDLLLYGDAQIQAADLIVPHPRMGDRAFVLLPLLDIDADVQIPGLGRADALIAQISGQTIRRIHD